MVLVLAWFLCSFLLRREIFTKQIDYFLVFGHTLALVAILGVLHPVKKVLAYGGSLQLDSTWLGCWNELQSQAQDSHGFKPLRV